MDTFNLKDAADQSLKLLEQTGISAKTVKEYRTTGFGMRGFRIYIKRKP